MFSPQTLDFLIQNKIEDSRDWFHEHREQYLEYVTEPMKQLLTELAPPMLEIDEKLILNSKSRQPFSRINRDIRYTNDKSLYRDYMWLSIKRDKLLCPHFPEFFFVFSPDGFMYGTGWYCAAPETTAAFRRLITEDNKLFRKAMAAYKKQDIFTVDGFKYKRSKYSEYPEDVKDWLDRKNICFTAHSNDMELLFSDNLHEKLANDFTAVADIYSFMLYSEEHKHDPE